MKTIGTLTSAIAFTLLSSVAAATPIVINAQLTGDIRADNPDNLFVDVTITTDTTSAVASWLVDINSPAHPSIKLDAFFFNLTGVTTDYSFSGFSPTSWSVEPAGSTTGAGAGNSTFLFEADTANPGTDVTNSVSLSFDMTLASGFFTADIFMGAGDLSGDAGSGQLGAHLQSLTESGNCPGVTGGCTTDSGFAFGGYVDNTPPDPDPDPDPDNPVPVPGTLLLLGLGLFGLRFARKSAV